MADDLENKRRLILTSQKKYGDRALGTLPKQPQALTLHQNNLEPSSLSRKIPARIMTTKFQQSLGAGKYRFNNNSHFNILKSDTLNKLPTGSVKQIDIVKDLIQKTEEEILLSIIDERNGTMFVFEKAMDHDLIAYLLIAMGKAVKSSMSKLVHRAVNKITCSRYFIISLSKYLASFQKKSFEQHHLQSLASTTYFLSKFQICLPSSASDALIILMPLLKRTCEVVASGDTYSAILTSLNDIEEQNNIFLKRFSPAETRNISHKEKLQLQEPPENYRTIPVLPRAQDFRCPTPFLRPNLVNGSYQDTEHYLDVQFRLLREDYMKSLRDGIEEYLYLKKEKKSFKDCKSVKVYENVNIMAQEVVPSGLIHIAYFNDNNFADIKWEYSKRFLSGSLLCFSDNDFETMLFATVAERKIEELLKGNLLLRFEELTNEVLNLDSQRNFVVLETMSYFEAFRHNLEALSEFEEDNFPMKRYIVDVEKLVLKPKYLSYDTQYDMRPLFLPLDKANTEIEKINPQIKQISVLDDSCWPTPKELNLDSGQYQALKAAITKEFVVIQGPPGTGKTYIGLRVVQLLLHNLDKWTSVDNVSPILIVCYTNHALDQFLEGISIFTKKIVRIGGRGKNDDLEEFQLRNLRKSLENNRNVPQNLFINLKKQLSDLHELRERIENNKILGNPHHFVLDLNKLKPFILDNHFVSLCGVTGDKILKEQSYNKICRWLGINAQLFEDTTDDANGIVWKDLSTDYNGYQITDIVCENRQKSVSKNPHLYSGEKFKEVIVKEISNIVKNCIPLTVSEAEKITNIQNIEIFLRWKLYKFWVQRFEKMLNSEYNRIENSLRKSLPRPPEFSFTSQQRLRVITHKLKSLHSYVLSIDELRNVISRDHYHLLRKYSSQTRTSSNAMFCWLELIVVNQYKIADREKVLLKLKNVYSLIKKETQSSKKINFEDNFEFDGDIEYIEAERNFGDDEFADTSFDFRDELKKKSSHFLEQSSDGFQFQGGKKAIQKYISKCLRNYKAMSAEQAENIKNIWRLSTEQKWQLYKYWLNCFSKRLQDEKIVLLKIFRETYKEYSELSSMVDIHVCKGAYVIGVTTTGAAKHKHIIRSLSPKIVVIEEAAEILESHIVTSLTRHTQHVILIGDHQQLKPNTTVHMLAVKYDLNISLFERMVKNGLECHQLQVQHRMRPEISALLVPHIYKNLENHISVTTYENLKGVTKNVFFISHNHNELKENESKSRVNRHEAEFLIRLCKYLIDQSYDASQITILTAYSGQLFEMKKIANKDENREKINGVKITVVDNYQGEENDIILVSFVRSNDEGDVGFLKVSNRVCVALSRAKKGLFCIGNFNMLSEKSLVWQNITKVLQDRDLLGPALQLVCQNHPSTNNTVSRAEDFDSVPDGGCNIKCDYRLSCGHICPLMCHPHNKGHETIQCKKPCILKCLNGHTCKQLCYEECDPCKFIVLKKLNPCNHEIEAECHLKNGEIVCPYPCERFLPCGHECLEICGDKCTSICRIMCLITSTICGHEMHVECFRTKDECYISEYCTTPCKTLLNCGHICKGHCGTCIQGRKHVNCQEKCNRTLKCGHECKSLCYEDCGPCEYMVSEKIDSCGHEITIKCYLLKDAKCTFKCKKLLKCGHEEEAECHLPIDKIKCSYPCSRTLLCNHKCVKLCHEICTTKCEEICFITSSFCGHKIRARCFRSKDPDYLNSRCRASCDTELFCKHICSGFCNTCHQGRVHVPCHKKCQRSLVCGHTCQATCSIPCPPCDEICAKWCSHKKCSKKCFELCEKCQEPCDWICSHKKCTLPCGLPCNRTPCDEPCLKLLECGHPCVGFCGEPCPKLCRICNANELTELFFGNENKNNARYVTLEDCGHVFEVEGLTLWIKETDKSQNILESKFEKVLTKACPKCQKAIKRNYRFQRTIKTSLENVDEVKNIDFEKELNLDHKLLQKYFELKKKYSYLVLRSRMEYIVNIKETVRNIKSVLDSRKPKSNRGKIIMLNLLSIFAILLEGNMTSNTSLEIIYENVKELNSYVVSTSNWITSILLDDYLTASEQQLIELNWEVDRLRLAQAFLNHEILSFIPFKSAWTDLIDCVFTYSAFRSIDLKKFEEIFVKSRDEKVLEKFYLDIEFSKNVGILSLCSLSVGSFYKRSNGSVYFLEQKRDQEN